MRWLAADERAGLAYLAGQRASHQKDDNQRSGQQAGGELSPEAEPDSKIRVVVTNSGMNSSIVRVLGAPHGLREGR